jgi:hypothetical protein
VSSENSEVNTHSERLRKDYQGAFDEWALQVSRLQAIASSTPEAISEDTKQAEERTAAAEVAYRDSRDRLTDDMGWTPPGVGEPALK